jgi:uncharacterized protein (DUF488 family)
MDLPSKYLFTIGYQGKQIGQFRDLLKAHKINVVADIREIPYSRNRDFSQKNIAAHLMQADIEYRHFPQLGSPAWLRQEMKASGDYRYFFEQYEKHLSSQSDALKYLCNIMDNYALCLLCMESDNRICHRTSVAERLGQILQPKYKMIINHL